MGTSAEWRDKKCGVKTQLSNSSLMILLTNPWISHSKTKFLTSNLSVVFTITLLTMKWMWKSSNCILLDQICKTIYEGSFVFCLYCASGVGDLFKIYILHSCNLHIKRIKRFYWHYNFTGRGIKIWTHRNLCIMKSKESVVLMVERREFHTSKCNKCIYESTHFTILIVLYTYRCSGRC